MKENKAFFFKLIVADLFDFATDPAGENMTLLQFAKELKRGSSEIEYIQRVINEAHNYMLKQSEKGRKGGIASANKRQPVLDQRQPVLDTGQPISRTRSSNIKTLEAGVVPVKPSRPTTLPDGEWLDSLKEDLAYKHINVNVEFSKMKRWCEMNNKPASKKRFINWLNRIEAPLKGQGTDGKIWDATGMTNMQQMPDGSYRKLIM